MENEDIIKLAMEYGFTGGFDAQGNLTYDATFVEAVTEAVKREREACAKVCNASDLIDFPTRVEDAAISKCAKAIRARSISRGEA